MQAGSVRYSESLLQWIWQNLEFDCNDLQLQNGDKLQIVDPGRLNHGAGPDFVGAAVQIGSVTLHGSVEIHIKEDEWFEHGHELDENFNSVVLHVVLTAGNQTGVLQNGFKLPTLVLDKYLTKSLYKLLEIKESEGLPCAGINRFIHQKAFEEQVERAHREYFEYKVNELLRCYPPERTPSEAWRFALIHRLYSALGIPHNRSSMEKLFLKVDLESERRKFFLNSEDAIVQEAFSTTGRSYYNWKFSGMRPGSSPQKRVPQAVALHMAIEQYPIQKILKCGLRSWEELLAGIPSEKLPGKSRLNILYTTVFLPSIYLFGDLFHSRSLKDLAYQNWREASFQLPVEVVRPFKSSGFQITKEVNKAGLAHHYKRYCRERNCHRCEVFKSAINP